MKPALVTMWVLLGGAGVAAASGLEEYSPHIEPRPSSQLYEAACDADITVAGAVATVEMRQRIVNPGPEAMAASYEFTLPAGAVITGAAVKADAALAVPAKAPAVHAGNADVLGADPLVVRAVPGQADRYQAILQPLEPGHDAALAIRYALIAEPRAGALRMVFPAHVTDGKMTVCRANLRATPGPGATITNVRVGGINTGKGGAAAFVMDGKDVVVDLDLDAGGAKEPLVWTQTQPLADGWSASLVTVIGPRVKAAGARRVVFLVDGSRSMELVGRANVGKVVKALGAALPSGAEVEAILFDRTATRVFGDVRPATTSNLAAIEQAIATRTTANGTDMVAAFELAGKAIDGARGQAMVIVVSDGVLGDLGSSALVKALGSKASAVDVHAIVLDPATTRAPSADVMRGPVNLYGGAYVEVAVDELDAALAAIDEWMRPSWLELRLTNSVDELAAPTELRSGAGFTRFAFHRTPPSVTLVGHGDAQFKRAAVLGPAAPIAALAIGHATPQDLAGGPDADDGAVAKAERHLEHAIAATPIVDGEHMLAVLSATGRIAKSRRDMVKGGGRYERSIALADPPQAPVVSVGKIVPSASAIARLTLERLFREQLQPRAHACYQKALGLNAKLEGTVHYQFRLGRGEITEVQLLGLADAAFDKCLVDAGYSLTPPAPDFTVNADDQTLANYPITFSRRKEQVQIVLGDADSSSPLDIDAIQGGLPGKTITVDPRTPLGGLRPPKSP
ncbi:MAG: VWA domain-containing protein [Deltaproteobacteria bacterium]|nr:VWA domain-containing protein [Deltaproteobacteria bacterium]